MTEEIKRVSCISCGTTYTVRVLKEVRTYRCRNCQAVIIVNPKKSKTKKTLKSVKNIFSGALFGTIGMIIFLMGCYIHIWTVYLSFKAYGLFGAFITLALPVASQIYWFVNSIILTGTLINKYCVPVGIYIILIIILFIITSFMDE